MKCHIAGVALGLLFVSAYHDFQQPIPQIVTTESCKETLISYFSVLARNPEKLQNQADYPELKRHLETIKFCEANGLL